MKKCEKNYEGPQTPQVMCSKAGWFSNGLTNQRLDAVALGDPSQIPAQENADKSSTVVG